MARFRRGMIEPPSNRAYENKYLVNIICHRHWNSLRHLRTSRLVGGCFNWRARLLSRSAGLSATGGLLSAAARGVSAAGGVLPATASGLPAGGLGAAGPCVGAEQLLSRQRLWIEMEQRLWSRWQRPALKVV